MNTRSSSVRGFTLIELMVVITIIGLLASSVLVALGTVRAKSRDTRRTADIRSLMTALELYNNDHAAYPLQSADPTSANFVSALTTALVPAYMDKLPIDPTNSANAVYLYENDSANADGYILRMYYERSPQYFTNAGSADYNKTCVRGVNINTTTGSTMGVGTGDYVSCK